MVKTKVGALIRKSKKIIFKNKRRFYSLLIITMLIILLLSFFDLGVNPVIIDTVEISSKSIATRAMNSAISDVMNSDFLYDDIINILSDESGNIKFIQANNTTINRLSNLLVKKTEEKITSIGEGGIKIPLGSFTGLPIFVGRGPKVKIKAMPIGAVTCVFSSKFESTGINQTNHKIYVKINSNIGVVMPLMSVKFQQQQEILISESIIVGQVPEVYLYSDNLDNLLNFVPF